MNVAAIPAIDSLCVAYSRVGVSLDDDSMRNAGIRLPSSVTGELEISGHIPEGSRLVRRMPVIPKPLLLLMLYIADGACFP